jgi:hypothetical protein
VGAQLAIGFKTQASIKDYIENGTVAAKPESEADGAQEQVRLELSVEPADLLTQETVEVTDTESVEATAEQKLGLDENENTAETKFNMVELGALETGSLPDQIDILAQEILNEETQ